MKYIKQYALKAASLGVILYALAVSISFIFPDSNIIYSRVWILVFGVCCISIFSELITLSGILLEKKNLVPYLLGSMVSRLLLGLIMLTILLLTTQNDRVILAINFMVIYLCFMVFEINASIANLRQFFEKGRNNEQIQQ